MKNTHLSHPEDSIFLGKQAVLDTLNWLQFTDGICSVKYDGAPAIVFGTDPETKNFFVGTKSVFNKKKIMINYDHNDIDRNHGHNAKVASILHVAYECLPRVASVIQADFIGYGGTDTATPNIITYSNLPKNVSLIVAAHTEYIGDTIQTMKARPLHYKLDAPRVAFLNTGAVFNPFRDNRINYLIKCARILAHFVRYPSKSEGGTKMVAINRCIRENREFNSVLSGNQLRLFNLITAIKQYIMDDVIVSEKYVTAHIHDGCIRHVGHEGYVHTNRYGTFKLVNRRCFSYYNFTLPKWSSR